MISSACCGLFGALLRGGWRDFVVFVQVHVKDNLLLPFRPMNKSSSAILKEKGVSCSY